MAGTEAVRGLGATPEEWLRLFFPQELVYFLRVAGFASVELANGFGRPPDGFGGRRLVARATRGK